MITTLSGNSSFLLNEELKKRIAAFVKEHTDISVEKIDAAEQDKQIIIDSLNGLPFLTPKKLIVLYDPSSNKAFIEDAEKLLSDLPESNELVIVESNIDKRSSFFKYLKTNTEFHYFEELKPNQLAGWLVDEAKSKDASISFASANYLVEQSGANQLKLSNELDKLISYDKNITRETIDLLVDPIPQTTIFQLLDAAFNGETQKLSRIYEDQRRQKVEPQQMMAMIIWQVHTIALVHSAGDMSAQEIGQRTGLSPFTISKSQRITKALNIVELRDLTRQVAELDFKLKNENINADEALKYLLFSIASKDE